MAYDPNNPFVDPRSNMASDLIMKIARQGLAGLQGGMQREAQGLGVLKDKATELYNQYAPAAVKEVVNYWNNTPDPIPGFQGDDIVKGVTGAVGAAAVNMEKVWKIIENSPKLTKLFSSDRVLALPMDDVFKVVDKYANDPEIAVNIIKAAAKDASALNRDPVQGAKSLTKAAEVATEEGAPAANIEAIAKDLEANPLENILAREQTAANTEALKTAPVDAVRDPYTKRALSQLEKLSEVGQARQEAEALTQARKNDYNEYVSKLIDAQESGKPLPGKVKYIEGQLAAPLGAKKRYSLAEEARPQIGETPPGVDRSHFIRSTYADITRRVTNDKNLQPTEVIGKHKKFLNSANTKEFEAALKEVTPEHADAIMRYVKGTNNFSTYIRNNPKASIQDLSVNNIEGLLTSVASKLLEKNPSKKLRVNLEDTLKSQE